MSAKHRNNKKSTRNGRRSSQYNDSVPHSRTVIPRSLFAAELDVKIPIFETFFSTSAGVAFAAFTYKVNTLNETTWSYVGLSAFSGIYKRYRVIAFDIKVHMGNNAAFNVGVTSLITNSATAAASYTDALQFAANPGGMFSLLGANTGDKTVTTHHHRNKVSAFEGTQEVETADGFAAATTPVDPAQLLYLQIAFSSGGNGGVTTFNMTGRIFGHLVVRYFDAINQ